MENGCILPFIVAGSVYVQYEVHVIYEEENNFKKIFIVGSSHTIYIWYIYVHIKQVGKIKLG